MRIKPEKENLLSWIQTYVPEKDLFFLSPELIENAKTCIDVILLPIDELYDHNTYGQIEYVNGYEYWNIKNATHAVVADKSWIETLPVEEQHKILSTQVKTERGLTVPTEFIIDRLNEFPANYIVNEHVVIQRQMWENLSQSLKEYLLTNMVYEWWDKGDCEDIPEWLPSFLKRFANTFGSIQGANCFAAVVFSISEGQQEWFLYEWTQQKTFMRKLQQYNYIINHGTELQKEDVVIWKDDQGTIQHAAYYLGKELFFNKHGQTIFNPWKLISREELYKEWEDFIPEKYRKTNKELSC